VHGVELAPRLGGLLGELLGLGPVEQVGHHGRRHRDRLHLAHGAPGGGGLALLWRGLAHKLRQMPRPWHRRARLEQPELLEGDSASIHDIPQGLTARDPEAPVGDQGVADGQHDRLGQIGDMLPRVEVFLVDHLGEGGAGVDVTEGGLATDQQVEDAAQREDIRSGVDLGQRPDLLGGDVALGAHDGARHGDLGVGPVPQQILDQAEVGDLGHNAVVGGLHQDVGWLEVPMHQPASVDRADPREHPPEQLEGLGEAGPVTIVP
jgi:hypothetical protein